MDLSKNDKKTFLFIKEFIEKTGQPPTLEEIRAYFGYKSLTSVQRSIKVLEILRLVSRDKYQQRGLKITRKSNEMVNIPLVGTVACGTPLLATENIEGYVPVDTKLITSGNPKDYFFLRASGNSMDEAGINDGDLVLIKSQNNAHEDQRVVALINDEATIKYLRKGDNYVALVPKSSNPLHRPIILHNDSNLLIQGIVVEVFGV